MDLVWPASSSGPTNPYLPRQYSARLKRSRIWPDKTLALPGQYSTSFNHALRRVLDQGTKTWTLSTTHQIVWNSMFDTSEAAVLALPAPLASRNVWPSGIHSQLVWCPLPDNVETTPSGKRLHVCKNPAMIRRPGFGDWMAANHRCYPITAAWAFIYSKNQSSTAPRDAAWAIGTRCISRCMFSNSCLAQNFCVASIIVGCRQINLL